MQNFKAVLFDFDGVLADTMEDNFQAWKKTFLDYGFEIKKEDYFLLEGKRITEVAEDLSAKYHLDINLQELADRKSQYYFQDNRFSFYTGVEELISELRKRNKLLALVSASPRKKLENTLSQEFLRQFQAVISGEDTEKGKPSQEPYLAALRKLNLSPEDCIVVENAPLGIRSAKAAGLYCIALTTTLNEYYLKEADMIVKSHAELTRLLLN